MPSIEVLKSGMIDQRESAFPQAVQLPNGDVLCSFSVGGGAEVTGGTDWARSTDGGETWQVEGTILPADEARGIANFLKLSLSTDGKTVYAYGSTIDADISKLFGERDARAIICKSTDGGRSWSEPRSVDLSVDCALEVSFAALVHRSGRLLAPGATLAAKEKLGERVIVALSDDGGETWPRQSTVFYDPTGEKSFFEHKFTELPNGEILATAWTVTQGDYSDLENSYAISADAGETWGPICSTGIKGQTMSTVALGDNRLLVLYNRRYGEQAVVMCLVTLNEEGWTIHHEGVMYDAKASHQRAETIESGIEELNDFAFGFPTGIRLSDETILATHWCHEGGKCGVRWTKLGVDWG